MPELSSFFSEISAHHILGNWPKYCCVGLCLYNRVLTSSSVWYYQTTESTPICKSHNRHLSHKYLYWNY